MFNNSSRDDFCHLNLQERSVWLHATGPPFEILCLLSLPSHFADAFAYLVVDSYLNIPSGPFLINCYFVVPFPKQFVVLYMSPLLIPRSSSFFFLCASYLFIFLFHLYKRGFICIAFLCASCINLFQNNFSFSICFHSSFLEVLRSFFSVPLSLYFPLPSIQTWVYIYIVFLCASCIKAFALIIIIVIYHGINRYSSSFQVMTSLIITFNKKTFAKYFSSDSCLS